MYFSRIVIFFCVGMFFLSHLPMFGYYHNSENEMFAQGEKLLSKGLAHLNKREYSEASACFLICLKDGYRFGPDFADLNRSFVMLYIKKVVQADPALRDGFVAHFRFLVKQAEKGKVIPLQLDHLSELVETLGVEKELIETFSPVVKSLSLTPHKKQWIEESFDVLYRYEQFQAIGENIDLVKMGRDLLAFCRHALDAGRWDALYMSVLMEETEEKLRKYYRIYSALQNKKNASEMEKMIEELGNLSCSGKKN